MIDTTDFPYWDAMNIELKGKVSSKVRKWANYIVKDDRSGLWYQGDGQWVINPLPGYNKTAYTIKNDKQSWYCNCQGFQSKLKRFNDGDWDIIVECSHIQITKLVAGAMMQEQALKRKGLIL